MGLLVVYHLTFSDYLASFNYLCSSLMSNSEPSCNAFMRQQPTQKHMLPSAQKPYDFMIRNNRHNQQAYNDSFYQKMSIQRIFLDKCDYLVILSSVNYSFFLFIYFFINEFELNSFQCTGSYSGIT